MQLYNLGFIKKANKDRTFKKAPDFIKKLNLRSVPISDTPTTKILTRITKEFTESKATTPEAFKKHISKKYTVKSKDAGKLLAGGTAYLVSRNNPKYKNIIDVVSSRKINLYNKKNTNLHLKVPTKRSGT